MIDANSLAKYSSEFLDTAENVELKQRLGLYQVFLRLYEHHRGLLDEILNLENSRGSSLLGVMFPYVQGVVLGQQVYLVTNLLKGKTQTFTQPQNIWVIGRDSRQVTLPIADKRLSRCHAAIQYVENQGFYLTDFDSSNGSYVNGERVWHNFLLKDGDRIRLGSLTLVFLAGNESQSVGELSPELAKRFQRSEVGSAATSGYAAMTDSTPAKRLSVNPLEETLTFMRDSYSNLP